MPRIIFPNNTQVEYLREIKSISGLNSNQLGLICGVVGRSFRDWFIGKLSISQTALMTLQNKFPEVKVPKNIDS